MQNFGGQYMGVTQPTNTTSGGNVGGANGGDHGQQFLPTRLNGDWQSDRDVHHRREMIQHIIKLLKPKDKNASPEWLTNMRKLMVKTLEFSLYRSAPSFEAYSDTSTLKHRLQQLAMEIARKTQQAKGEVKSNNGGRKSDPHPHHGPMNQSSMGGMSNNRVPRQGGHGMGPQSQMGASFRIRLKQQRLLLLHHSSKCPNEDAKCKVTPYCGEMKKLWKHMARCNDNECRVAHCFSSRSIMSHYRKCKDPRCPTCGAAREAVRKSRRNNGPGGTTQNQRNAAGGGSGSGVVSGGVGVGSGGKGV